jgi:DNA primase
LGRIADEIIQEVRDRVDLVDLVGRHLTLKKSGRNYVGLCPFHHEKTASFNVNSERQSYFCFGCQEGGNAFTFLMHVENLTFPEAVRTLARECGIEIPESGGENRGDTEALYRANEIAQIEYRKAISVPENPALAYLAGRGFDAGAIEKYQLGFAPDRWDTVTGALQAEGITGEIGMRAGLLAERKSGGHYDRLRGRVTFAIRDVRGRAIGFGGRAISSDQEPKYLNSAESPIFRKREAFYGYPDALGPIRKSERAVVVEGYFDQIALDRAGLGGVVASCGTALTSDHVRDLRLRTREVVLLFDGDEAGHRALEKALQLLLPEGLRVRAALLPPGDDPDSFSAREGSEPLRALIDSARPAIENVIHRTAAKGHDTAWRTADAVAAVVPMIALIPDGVERSEFATQLALAVGAQTQHVEAAVLAQRRGQDPLDAIPERPRKRGPEERIVAQLLRSLIECPQLVQSVSTGEVLALLPAGPAAEIAEVLLAVPASSALDLDALCGNLGDEAETLLRELAASSTGLDIDTASRVLTDTIGWLKKRMRSEEERALTQRLREGGEDWRAVFEAKQRLRARPQVREHRRMDIPN